MLVGLHHSITLSFLLVGHTKFVPDWCFDLLKQSFRLTKVGSIDSIAGVVDRSAEVNVSQLVGTLEGETLVQTYRWDDYFSSYMRKLVGIKKYHHCQFTIDSPGVVFVKEFSDSDEIAVNLLKDESWVPNSRQLQDKIHRPGLSLEGQ